MTQCEKEIRDELRSNIIREIDDCGKEIAEIEEVVAELTQKLDVQLNNINDKRDRIIALWNLLRSIDNEIEEGL